MSIKVMTWVWDNAEIAGADLLLLLAIADHCNDDGECYPGIKRLAKMARVSESHAKTLIRKLKDAKDISVVINAGIETGHGATNRYYVNGYRQHMNLPYIPSTETARLPEELKKPKKKAWGIADNTRIGDSTPTGIADNTSGVLQIIPKPSVEPSVEPIATKVAKPYYDAIVEILNIHGGRNANIEKMLSGKATNNGYKQYNLNPAVSLEEFKLWGAWYKTKNSGVSMVQSPEKIQSSIMAYRAVQVTPRNASTAPSPTANAARAMSTFVNQKDV